MLFVTQRDKVVGSTAGYFIRFEKGKPTFVPKCLWEEVQAAGAVPVDTLPSEEAAPEFEVRDPSERKALFYKAFSTLVERNERGDFTASGLPNSKTLEKILGFQVINKERDDLWSSYLESTSEADK